MDKWTESQITPPNKGSGFKKKHAFLGVAAIVFAFIVHYLYTCTCIFGSTICHKQGKLHDAKDPYITEVKFSFLAEPGKLVYPWASMMLKEEGSVGVELTIDKNGIITKSKIFESSKFEYLDQAALNSIPTLLVDSSKIDNENGSIKKIKFTFKIPNEKNVTSLGMGRS
ncbi:TonB family protein [Microbulbifer sp. ANSA001]|uniref:TonB family protein n=1 Tax=Microbulbifer sp. ANSA001 TaxID=3243358 RepID=UPI004042013D